MIIEGEGKGYHKLPQLESVVNLTNPEVQQPNDGGLAPQEASVKPTVVVDLDARLIMQHRGVDYFRLSDGTRLRVPSVSARIQQ